MDKKTFEQHLSSVEENGYAIIEDVIAPGLLQRVRDTVARLEDERGVTPRGNRAEGFATKRMYNLLDKDRVFWELPVHEDILPFAERLLDPECLLSGTTCMHIGPGEVMQGLHSDDVLVSVPRPRMPFMVTTIWAFTDFTDANGATRLVPGSHRFDHEPDYSKKYEHIAAEMPAGSVLIVNGGTWHSGGDNKTEDDWRLGISIQYCQGWLRQQQNQYYAIKPEDMREMPERLAKLCGFTLYRGIMGHIDGASPGGYLGSASVSQTAYSAVPSKTD